MHSHVAGFHVFKHRMFGRAFLYIIHCGFSNIRCCQYYVCMYVVWIYDFPSPRSIHQEIHPNSPAAQAGLIPHTDYILGSEMMVAGDDDLYSLIESHNHQEIKLYVYNADTDSCREVRALRERERENLSSPV